MASAQRNAARDYVRWGPASKKAELDVVETRAPHDDLDREVYAILGVPIDAIDMAGVLHAVDVAAAGTAPFLISTPNLNFLITCRRDRAFKESLLMSDLCPADGMPIVWIARLLGLPIKGRVAGSEMFEALKSRGPLEHPLRVFLFGGQEGVASLAAARLNAETSGVVCAGTLCPGFGSVEDMSSDAIINQINASDADFLLAALGAAKGQAWLRRNHDRLTIPVRSHLGATLNFQAQTLKPAPAFVRRLGLEWLWRIKEEPHLWRRYWNDGWTLLKLMLTRVAPLALLTRLSRANQAEDDDLRIVRSQGVSSVVLKLSGWATANHAAKAASWFRDAAATGKPVIIDLYETRHIDARFFGLLLMLRKTTNARRSALRFVGLSSRMKRTFKLHDMEFLLNENSGP
jgi:N-acetylglucosaminyldiphosphoundecaprenol N-acetyl-beta-D-mannosaminyltransferase